MTTPPSWCPRCLTVTDADTCPRCELPQRSVETARLRVVVYRLSEIDRQRDDLAREQIALTSERDRLLALVTGGRTTPAPPITAAGVSATIGSRASELRADVVRDVLLWVGGLLLALAALIFAAFAWRRLDDDGRALLLLGATVLAGVLAVWLRPRLRATAEVFSALTLVMLAIDWLAVRTAGVGAELDLPTWWAIGSGGIAAVALLAGRFFVSARLLMAAGATVSATLGIFAGTETAASAALAFALAAAAAVVGGDVAARATWTPAASILRAAAAAGVSAGAIGVLAGIADGGEPSPALAIAAAACAIPAAIAAWLSRETVRDGCTFVAVVALLGAASILWWMAIEEPWLVVAIVATSAAVVAAAALLPTAQRTPVMGAGGLVFAIGGLSIGDRVAGAIFGPLEQFTDAWDVDAAVRALQVVAMPSFTSERMLAAGAVVLITAIALAIIGARASHDIVAFARPLAGAALGAAIALVPLARDLRVGHAALITGGALALAMAGVGALARKGWDWSPAGAAALILLSPAVGWAVAGDRTTIGLSAIVFISALAAVAFAPSGHAIRPLGAAVAAAAFVFLAATSALGSGATAEQAGIATVCAAGAVLIAATLWPTRDTEGVAAEVVGAVAAGTGIALAWNGEVERAIALTALVPCLAVPGTRPDRRAYLTAAALFGVFASWAWLAAADVQLVEAYSLPAALGALVAGEVHRRQNTSATSWTTYGAAIAIAFAPTLVVAVDETELVRPVALAVAAAAACWAGSRWRLQAPLVAGALTLTILAVDTLAPVAEKLPRWLTVAFAGALLVWLGATAERRMNQLRAARERFEALENGTAEKTPG